MPSHTFTPDAPQITVPLSPPLGTTAVVINASVNRGAADPQGGVRLFHLRTKNSTVHPTLAAEGRLPRESEVLELICRAGVLTAGFSGFGGNHTKHQPVHMGTAPASFPVTLTVPFTGRQAVVAAGVLVATSDTDVAPNGQPLELLLGFAGQGDLSAPLGWTISWEADAVTYLGASQPEGPPPTTPPIVPPTPPPSLPPATPGPDPRAAAIAAALALLAPHLTAAQMAAVQALLPLLLLQGGA